MNFLEDEDVAFVKRFILFSGSPKDLADAYNVDGNVIIFSFHS